MANTITLGYVILIILLIIIIVVALTSNGSSLVENFSVQYYKCPKYGNNKITNSIFDKENINRSDDQNVWDLYIPCGYNLVENELKTIKPGNANQKIFGINGCDHIVSKNGLWNLIETKYGRNIAKKLMPETFIIGKDKDIELFKKCYKPNKLYLMKKNIQRKLGIKITKDLNEILGNTDTKFRVIQEYLTDQYLVHNRKINLRIYLLITCKDGKIKAYVHQLGKCIYTNQDYNSQDLEPEKHLTSLNVSLDVYKNRPQSFQQLSEFLGKKQYETLMSNIYNNLILVMKAAKPRLCKLANIKDNLSFQLFGLDYIFTNNMYPYLLEMNKGPDMNAKNDLDTSIKTKVIRDAYLTVDILSNTDTPNGFMRLKID